MEAVPCAPICSQSQAPPCCASQIWLPVLRLRRKLSNPSYTFPSYSGLRAAAFAVTGANARRVQQIAAQYSGTRVSVLIEAAEQFDGWRNTGVGIFLDINSGMNRTGISRDAVNDVTTLAKLAGPQFRGLHYYD